MPTIYDVSKSAGVSPKTVSRVINNENAISESTRQKVLRAIESLNYSPNASARRLKLGKRKGEENGREKTFNLGVIVSAVYIYAEPYFSRILQGIEKETVENGYHLYFSYTFSLLSNNPGLFSKVIDSSNIDGVIFVNLVPWQQEEIIDRVKKEVDSVVCIDTMGIYGMDSIEIDKVKAGYDAVRYLYGKGHKRIGFVGRKLEKGRYDGYMKGLGDLGLEHDESVIEGGDCFGVEEGYRSMMKILERASPVPSAVFAASDQTAIGVMKAIRQKGLNVPADISVVGFDNINESEHTVPPLTTFNVDKEGLGRMGVRRLIERIQNPGIQPMKVVVPAGLVIRESCRNL